MALYEYKCVNINCKKRNEIKIINKPMSKASETEYCEECNKPLRKIFGSPSVKTGDGFKS